MSNSGAPSPTKANEDDGGTVCLSQRDTIHRQVNNRLLSFSGIITVALEGLGSADEADSQCDSKWDGTSLRLVEDESEDDFGLSGTCHYCRTDQNHSKLSKNVEKLSALAIAEEEDEQSRCKTCRGRIASQGTMSQTMGSTEGEEKPGAEGVPDFLACTCSSVADLTSKGETSEAPDVGVNDGMGLRMPELVFP